MWFFLLFVVSLSWSSACGINKKKSLVYSYFDHIEEKSEISKFYENDAIVIVENQKFTTQNFISNYYKNQILSAKTISYEINEISFGVVNGEENDLYEEVIINLQLEAFYLDGYYRVNEKQKWKIEKKSSKIVLQEIKYLKSSTRNKVKQKLESGEAVYGGFVTIPSPKVVENLAVPGKLDFIWIEAEHPEFYAREAQELVRTCENEGLVPIIRVPINGLENIKKYVGTGTLGIIVPNIISVQDAKDAVNSILYFPEGMRHAGAERGNRYLGRFAEYMKTANEDMLVVVMIEHINAVNNIENLVNISRIDVFSMGPYDLALSMGKTSTTDPEVQAAIAHVEKVCNDNGKILGGAAGTYSNAQEMQKRGYRFFSVPGDMELLQNGIKNWFMP